MLHTLQRAIPALLATACAFGTFGASAEPGLRIKIGPASIGFDTRSGELNGPPASTPPGVLAEARDSQTLGFVVEQPLDARWSAVLQLGVPPTVRFDGAGTGAALGEVGRAQVWFPAALLGWRAPAWGSLQPYAALGAHVTVFTRTAVTPAYTAAFGGSSSRVSLKRSVGPVLKLGAEWSFGPHWLLDLSAARYAIRTEAQLRTDTPGLGEISRQVGVRVKADVLALMVGYQF
jgi:outer membrane protein